MKTKQVFLLFFVLSWRLAFPSWSPLHIGPIDGNLPRYEKRPEVSGEIEILNGDSLFKKNNNIGAKNPLNPPPVTNGELRFREFLLQNTLKPSKTVTIPNHEVEIQINETSKTANHLSRFNTVGCLLDSIRNDSLCVTLLTEEIDEEYRDRFQTMNIAYYPGAFNNTKKTFALKDIHYIQMKSPLREFLTQIGTVFMSGGILLIVTSPLAGYQLKSEARSTVRTRVFTAGLACIGVSLPFFIGGKNKKYGLSPAFLTKKNNYWQLRHR